jgi:hypothetical protein
LERASGHAHVDLEALTQQSLADQANLPEPEVVERFGRSEYALLVRT